MTKRKRHAPRCRSTPTQLCDNSEGMSNNAGSQQSEPVTQHFQPTLPEVQNPQPTQPEAQNPPHLGTNEAEDPPRIYGKKCNKYWTVDVIDEEGVVKETRLKVQDVFVFVLRAGKRVMT